MGPFSEAITGCLRCACPLAKLRWATDVEPALAGSPVRSVGPGAWALPSRPSLITNGTCQLQGPWPCPPVLGTTSACSEVLRQKLYLTGDA